MPALAQVDELSAVQPVRLLIGQPPRPVHRPPHVPETVHLDHVAQALVNDQAPADQLGVEGEVVHGETYLAQVLLGVVIGPALPLHHLVMHEGVVHVVADDSDRPQVQRAAAEDGALGLCRNPPGFGRAPLVQAQVVADLRRLLGRYLHLILQECVLRKNLSAHAFPKIVHWPIPTILERTVKGVGTSKHVFIELAECIFIRKFSCHLERGR
mmetsp:Transcript_70749/g.188854  ORF Transcript_70749/g.188854 Transcript_70749/m.188854 type:complete len:212 (+) Transcript_70749:2064-2699(+)